MDEMEKEILKQRKVDRVWENWLAGYLIYAEIIARANPWKGATLLQYLDIIYKAYSYFTRPCWLQYGEEFHKRRADFNPSWHWDQVYPQF